MGTTNVQRRPVSIFCRSRGRPWPGDGEPGVRPERTPRRVSHEKASERGVLRSLTRDDRRLDEESGHPGREWEFLGLIVNFVGVGAIPSWFEALLFIANGFRVKNGGVGHSGRGSRSRSRRVHEMHRSSSTTRRSVHFMHPTVDHIASAPLPARARRLDSSREAGVPREKGSGDRVLRFVMRGDGASCGTNRPGSEPETTRKRGDFCVIRVICVAIGAFESSLRPLEAQENFV